MVSRIRAKAYFLRPPLNWTGAKPCRTAKKKKACELSVEPFVEPLEEPISHTYYRSTDPLLWSFKRALAVFWFHLRAEGRFRGSELGA